MKSKENLGSVLGLNSIKELLRRMNNPQNRIRTVHVAGTNGKGSVIAILNSILQAAGYKTGRYISPAVFSYRECMQINGKDISEDEFADIMSEIRDNAECMTADNLTHPTVFEMETAAAYEFFYRNNCDVAIIETGLGGREDATNVIESPEVCVITSISLDHTGILGNTLTEIAREKAGIIMKNSKVVVMNQSKEVLDEIKKESDNMNCEMYVTGNAYDIVYGEGITSFSYDDERYDIMMPGTFQVKNAVTAIETAHILCENGFCISGKNIYEGVKNTVWKGRFERICKKPDIYIDGAHNPDAAKMFVDTLDKVFNSTKKVFIFGMLADKDYERVAEITSPYAEAIITITPDNKRALSGDVLAEAVKKYNNMVEYEPDMRKALKKAIKIAKKKKAIIIAFGSLSYLGEVRKIVED